MVRVVVAGHVNWDVTLRVDALPEPDGEARIRSRHAGCGGSAANVGAALSGLDVSAGVVGAVGDDENGTLARRALEEAGVDLAELSVVPDGETTTKYLVVAADSVATDGPADAAGRDRPAAARGGESGRHRPAGGETDSSEPPGPRTAAVSGGRGEVMVLGNDGVNEAVAPGDVDPDYVRTAEHLHLTSQAPATAAHLVDVAVDAGCTVSFDPGRRLADRNYESTVARADLLFCTEREAASLLGDGPGSFVAGTDHVVVVKRGERGATAHTSTETVDHPGFAVDPVDTTGAGDAFAAGFLSAWLDGEDVERALAVANACGALAAQGEGAQTAPSTSAVESFLAARQ